MKVLLIGNGQVGNALATIIEKHHDLTVMDLDAKENPRQKFDVMHICYPYTDDFIPDTTYYIRKFTPELTLIESTVKPGTTRKIWSITDTLICHSPVRGCHQSLLWGLTTYTKFIGACTRKAALLADDYYRGLGMKTYVAAGSIETEIAKLANLSKFATDIVFFQELERKATEQNINLEDVIHFFRTTTEDSGGEVQRPILKGNHIEGTCVMQGLRLLFNPGKLHEWIEESNRKCLE